MKITLSVIKADIGGYVGHSESHPDILNLARSSLNKARDKGLLTDFHVTKCGDDAQLIMTHKRGINNKEIHKLAWDTFVSGTELAKKLKLYGAGQDLLSDAFSGNVKGMGPGVAEMEIEERTSEPIIIFMADKTSSGAWNLPLYKMFADPFNTIGLVIAPNMHSGFAFEVHDVKEHTKVSFNTPEDIYDLLVFIGAPSRYAVKAVYSRDTGDIAAVSSCVCRPCPRHLPGGRRSPRAIHPPDSGGGLDAWLTPRPAHAGSRGRQHPGTLRRTPQGDSPRLSACPGHADRASRYVRR